MKSYGRNVLYAGLVIVCIVILTSCGNSGSSTTTGNGVGVTGSVSSPGGTITTASASTVWSKLAKLFFAKAYADLPGVSPVGSGVTVKLVQIDSSGNQVSILATGQTDASGNFTLLAPADFTPNTKYVIVAEGSGCNLQSFVTSTSTNVNPYTQATVSLITGSLTSSGASIGSVSTADAEAVLQTVTQSSADVQTTSTTASQLVSDLKSTVNNEVESKNVVTSIGNQGGITGTVKDASGTALSGIRIVARTFGDQVLMGFTRTDSSGQYTLHLPAGNYILGAINDTTTSTAASQWWTTAGGVVSMFSAEKITISTAVVNKDFTLPAGGRLSGTVTAGTSGVGLAGIRVTLCDFSTGQTLMNTRTAQDGTYTFYVAAGTYYISFRNTTLQAYASAAYNSSIAGGASNMTQAEKITVSAGSSATASIGLVSGYQISGMISDPSTGVVAGVNIRFHDSTDAFSEGLSSGVDGTYRMWVQPGTYKVMTRGQMASLDASSANITQSFTAAVGKLTAILKDASGNAVSQIKVSLYDTSSSTSYQWLAYEVSNSDGSVTLYGTPGASVYLSMLVQNGAMIASQVYLNKTNYPTSGTSVTLPSANTTTDLSTVTLSDGAVLTGTVTVSGVAAANKYVQLRYGGKSGNYRMLNVRTMVDGSYRVSLPASTTITRLCAYDNSVSCPGTGTKTYPSVYSGSGYAYTDSVTMGAAGTTTTVDLTY